MGRAESGTRPGERMDTRREREWVTVAEAAGLVDVPAVTLRVAAAAGHLGAQRSGKVWLVRLPAVRAWLKAAKHRPGPKPGQGVGRPRRPPETAPAPAAPAE
jgi:excisionase family DNA binding protein